ncbi:kelch-like protein 22 [Lolium rigidum]|uniref:kelch-like protein 22 n=1 Tax=Lolium rigidum TaxID=89674 RepID=UPI001F5C6CB0|nr:kelch-like protein 22 [Lolium rigidum]
MGTGRKTETKNVATPKQDQSNTRRYGDQSFPARNLGEDELGGVIFGCTHQTINECLSKQLFGLPSVHFSYVKNIKPGMPLFLFNYSDRKMHGIFEAATPGQIAIDQFAWSRDGRTKTQYPAQVRVSTKTQCLPLPETKYKSVISGNYYNFRHIYFELDNAQTRDLVSLFVPAHAHAIPRAQNLSGFPASVHAVRKEIDSGLKDGNQFGVSSHSNDMVPYKSVDRNANYGISSASRTSESNFSEKASERDGLNDSVTEKEIESVNDDHPRINPFHDEQHGTMAVLQKLQELSCLRQTLTKDSSNATLEGDAIVKDNTSLEQRCENDELLQIINELAKKTEAIWEKQTESDQERLVLRETVKIMETKIQQLQYQYEKLQLEYSAALLGEKRNNVEGPSIFLIGGHNGYTCLPSLDSFYPTIDRLVPLRPMSSARAYAAVAAFNEHLFVFGGGDGDSWYNTVESYNRVSNVWITCPCLKQNKGGLAGATLNGKIFAIGGGNGSQSFSEVEMFDPAHGSWIHSPSLQQSRFTTTATELNGVLYVAGGYDFNKDSYLQSLERYDPREGFWTQLTSMKTKRACHSVAVLGETLYALGGYDGNQMVSTVEIFDPRANSWRISSPFSVPRGYGCAVTVNDNVYLIGGTSADAESVETVEVYNERQGWSVPGYKAIGQRRFASAIAF